MTSFGLIILPGFLWVLQGKCLIYFTTKNLMKVKMAYSDSNVDHEEFSINVIVEAKLLHLAVRVYTGLYNL
jgi:hypothetical protein